MSTPTTPTTPKQQEDGDDTKQPMTFSSSEEKTEEQKMLDGELYMAWDDVLVQQRMRAKEYCFQYNQIPPSDTTKRQALMHEMLYGQCNRDKIHIESPFHIDYGLHLSVGDNFYANHGCTILDCNKVTIGDNCLLAPHVCISAATHPIDPMERISGAELTAPITIGDNVWIGASATICPGVTLGNNVVVGAGAVVTKSFPDNVVIGGVPAKILKYVDDGKVDKKELV